MVSLACLTDILPVMFYISRRGWAYCQLDINLDSVAATDKFLTEKPNNTLLDKGIELRTSYSAVDFLYNLWNFLKLQIGQEFKTENRNFQLILIMTSPTAGEGLPNSPLLWRHASFLRVLNFTEAQQSLTKSVSFMENQPEFTGYGYFECLDVSSGLCKFRQCKLYLVEV